MQLRFNDQHETRFTERDGKQYIEGYGSIFDNKYFVASEGFYETISPQAFNRSLAQQRSIESRYNHSQDHVLGRTDLGSLKVWIDERGLRYQVPFNPADPDHVKVRAKIDSGLIKGSSFAFVPKQVRFNREQDQDTCTVLDAELYEVGPVNDPANQEATAQVRSADSDTMSELYKEWQQTQELIKKAEQLTT